jgi:hypothetical protein
MHTQTTQVQVHNEANLGAYFLNEIPPSSSQVGLVFFGSRSCFVLEKVILFLVLGVSGVCCKGSSPFLLNNDTRLSYMFEKKMEQRG